MQWNSFCEFFWIQSTKDLVPLCDPKVHLFGNNLLKILAQLQHNFPTDISHMLVNTKINRFPYLSRIDFSLDTFRVERKPGFLKSASRRLSNQLCEHSTHLGVHLVHTGYTGRGPTQ